MNTGLMRRLYAPLGGTLLALLALTGILPGGPLTFALSFWAVLIWPGWLLTGIFSQLPAVRRIPVAFLLSIGMLSVPSVLLVRLESELAVLGWAVGLLIACLTGAYIIFGGRKAPESDGQPDWMALLPVLLAGAGLLALWAYRAPISNEGDHWFYLQFIRHFLDVGFTADLNPLVGQTASAGMLQRAGFNGWWGLQAVVYRASGLPLMDAYWYGLPPVLMVLSLLSLYGLGVQLFIDRRAALAGVLFQTLYLASSIGSHSWAGNAFFLNIAEDKYVVAFILLPAALAVWLQVVEKRGRGRLAALVLCLPALALTHPMGVFQFGAGVGGWLVVWISGLLAEKKNGWWIVAGGTVLLLFVLPLVSGRWVYRPFTTETSQQPPFYSQTILLDGERGQFMANPHVVAHPITLLSIGLSVLVLPRYREREGRFLLGVTWLPLLLVFHPFYAALLGRFSGTWLVWRVVWILPVALLMAWAAKELRIALVARGGRTLSEWLPIIALLVLALLSRNYLFDCAGLLRDQKNRFVPGEEISVLEALGRLSTPGDVALAPLMLNTHLPAFSPQTKLLSNRLAEAQDGLFEKILRFYAADSTDDAAFDLIQAWDVRFVILPRSQGPDMAWRVSPGYFMNQFENDRYVLYEVLTLPETGEWAPRPGPVQPAEVLNPSPAENDLAAAHRFREAGRLDEALAAYEKVLASDPEIFRLAGAEGARAAFGRSLTFDRRADRIAEAMLGMGAVYEHLGQAAQAEQTYNRLIALLPDRDAGYAALERLLVSGGRAEDVIAMYEDAARLFFWLTWPKIRLSDAYIAAGRPDEAAAMLKAVLRLTPRDVFSLVRLARLHRVERSLDLALLYGLQALEVSRRTHELAQSHYELGQIYWPRGDLDKALENFLATAELLPDDPVHHATIGDFYRLALNDPASALPYYRTAVSLAPENPSYLLTLGDLYRALDLPEQALEMYNAARVLDPNLPGLHERLIDTP